MNIVHAIIYLSLFNIFLGVGAQLTMFGEISQHQLANTDPYSLQFQNATYNTSDFTTSTFTSLLGTILGTTSLITLVGVVALSFFTNVPVLTSVGYLLFLGCFVGLWVSTLNTLLHVANLIGNYIPIVPGIFVAILSFCMFLQIIFTLIQIATGGWRIHQ